MQTAQTAPKTKTTPEARKKLTDSINSTYRQIMKPRPKLTGSEFANRHFILPAETATTPGAYSWKRAPYQREWLDVICDNTTSKIVLMTSARVGKTSCLLAGTAYFMANDPSSLMWMLPTKTEAERFSTRDLDPMLRDVPVVRSLVKDKRVRDSGNTKLQKKFKGGVIHLVGAESQNDLHGKTVRCLFADEIDRYKTTGEGDGDPLKLAEVRTSTFQHRKKIVIASTPTIKDLSVIEREFLASDQRYYHVPCPDCGHFQPLRWAQLDYKDSPADPQYVCEGCGVLIPEQKKLWMLSAGRWIATNTNATVPGYHINALYSTMMNWRELVEEWRAAQGNPALLHVFINQRLGEGWDDSNQRVNHHQLRQRLEAYNAPVPTRDETCGGVGILTAGVDIQGNRIECGVWGFGPSDNVYLVDAQIFDGDPGTSNDPWNALADYLMNARFTTKHGGSVGIRAIAVDSGYQTERVYRFVKDMRRALGDGRPIIAVKGVATYSRFIADRPSQNREHNILTYSVGTNIAKEHCYKMLMNTDGTASRVHLPYQLPTTGSEPRWLSDDVLQQLTAERPVTTYEKGKPKREWRKKSPHLANEAWDIFIYAYAVFLHLGPRILNDVESLSQKVAELVGSGNTPSTPTATASPPPTSVKHVAPGIRLHAPRRNGQFWQR